MKLDDELKRLIELSAASNENAEPITINVVISGQVEVIHQGQSSGSAPRFDPAPGNDVSKLGHEASMCFNPALWVRRMLADYPESRPSFDYMDQTVENI